MMQTDTWLTDTTHPDNCPLCSQPLAAGSNACPSCGFIAHEPAGGSSAPARTSVTRQAGPVTPIPARASALRSQGAAGSASPYPLSAQSAPFSSASARQARGLRHDSPSYEAVSSLSSLSLIIAETPTAPPRTTARFQHPGERRLSIDEIDTVPQKPGTREEQTAELDTPGALVARFDNNKKPGRALVPSTALPPVAFVHVDEIDTVPETGESPSSAVQSFAPERQVGRVDAASWTASPRPGMQSTRFFPTPRSPGHNRRVRHFSPLDRTRWWLLRPGHIEFLLWLAGSVLLFGITFLFLLALALSVLLPGAPGGGNFPRSNAAGPSGAATAAVNDGMRLKLAKSATLRSGTELRLLGQGFHPASRVTFWLDDHWPLLDQRGQPATVQADASGRFAVNLWLGQGTDWSAGPHQIQAREIGSGRQAAVSISIAPTVVAPGSNNPGPRSTPPERPTSTPAHRPPTPTPARPTPTPGQPTPTAGITPTASPSGTKLPGTPVGSPASAGGRGMNSSSLGNDLHTGDGGSPFARLLQLNLLIWLVGICYLLSMLFLGLAGVLHRRRG